MNHLSLLFSSKMNVVSVVLFLLLSSSMGFGQDICPGADVEVSAEGMSYSPAALMVEVGTTVGWVNYGGYHDVNGVNSSITSLPFYNPESFYRHVLKRKRKDYPTRKRKKVLVKITRRFAHLSFFGG